MTTPIDIRPSPCVTQARPGSACKISPPYVALFPSLSHRDAKATLNYYNRFIISCKLFVCCRIFDLVNIHLIHDVSNIAAMDTVTVFNVLYVLL